MAPDSTPGGRWFDFVHRGHLVYNCCWEDPRLDREAMRLGPDDTVLVVTSAGCNALDYALDAPRRIFAVDMNPRQNALLELKIAGIRRLDFDEFFSVFGSGRCAQFRTLYADRLRRELSEPARAFWDRKASYFDPKGWRDSFYFHGAAGFFARAANTYIDRVAKVRDEVNAALDAPTLDEQRRIFREELKPAFWKGMVRWALRRDATMALLGVPKQQRAQVEKYSEGGLAGFVEECVDAVFGRLSLADNYFWRVYLRGEYSRECCPEYLRERNFERLKAGLADRIEIRTDTIEGFLRSGEEPISRFVLLDHMDWLASAHPGLLESEWQAIADRAAPGARILWRSGGAEVDYVDPIRVRAAGREVRLGDALSYARDLAASLHERDRVHTYGSFHIADWLAAR